MSTTFITVSVEILQDKNLTPNEKFILADIHQLTTLDDGCYASNTHFAELLGIYKTHVSKLITSLTKKGYITTEIVKGSRNHLRLIKMTTPIVKMTNPPCQNDKPPLSKRQETKENIHSNIQNNIHTPSTPSRSNGQTERRRRKKETFYEFKNRMVSEFTGTFKTHGIGYLPETEFRINPNSDLLEKTNTDKKSVSTEDAQRIWQYLYENQIA